MPGPGPVLAVLRGLGEPQGGLGETKRGLKFSSRLIQASWDQPDALPGSQRLGRQEIRSATSRSCHGGSASVGIGETPQGSSSSVPPGR